jgi:phosphoglycolate phosphatase
MNAMRRAPGDAVLFDLDGVLVDSRTAISRCINHALTAHGLAERPASVLHPLIGPPLAAAFAELTGHPSDSPLVRSCVGSYRTRYAHTSAAETTVVPGITDALAELGERHTLAVATSKARSLADALLTALGLRAFFHAVAGPGANAHNEDKASTIAAVLNALKPRRAVMVGDRSFDMLGAQARGLPAIGVTWGIGTRRELAAARANTIITAPADLPGAVERLMAAQTRAAR